MENLIAITEFCNQHQIEISFISALQEYGLIQITTIEQLAYIPVNDLRRLEKMITLHYELEINIEGIETIAHLLDRMDLMQQEILLLKNRLRAYEND
jgi:chaperone modulatory protein CbpM